MTSSTPLDSQPPQRSAMDRRSFLARSGIALSAVLPAALLGRLTAFAAAEPPPQPLAGAGIEPDGWRTLGLVQEHLFPSEPQAPGAQEIHALRYLHFVMGWEGTDPAEIEILRTGLAHLRAIATRSAGRAFDDLDAQGRDQSLRTLEAEEGGTEWILLVLDYIFEALLADPVYGGNPDGIGWRWLAYEPGHRRPGLEQRYYVLRATPHA